MAEPAATIGYFACLQDDRVGWTGGLLVLNAGGRPLEFQCTLPIRPSKAHEILYGATLGEHVIGEVIAPTLLEKCRTPISILACYQIEALRCIEAIGSASKPACGAIPALVTAAAEADEGPIEEGAVAGHTSIAWRGSPLLVASDKVEAATALLEKLADLPDVVEPFDRIRDAIREAQSQIARAATAKMAA